MNTDKVECLVCGNPVELDKKNEWRCGKCEWSAGYVSERTNKERDRNERGPE